MLSIIYSPPLVAKNVVGKLSHCPWGILPRSWTAVIVGIFCSGGNPSNAPDVDSPTTTAQSFVEINTAGDLQLMKGEANPSEGRLVFTGAEDDDTKQTVSIQKNHRDLPITINYSKHASPLERSIKQFIMFNNEAYIKQKELTLNILRILSNESKIQWCSSSMAGN